MDAFGIGAAVHGVAEVYFRGARRTGRTNALLDTARSGDVVVFLDMKQAADFKRRCFDRGIEGVESFVIPPDSPQRVFDRPSVRGRLIFDHAWLEEHYLFEIRRVAQSLDKITTEASGEGRPHAETRKAAKEAARWSLC